VAVLVGDLEVLQVVVDKQDIVVADLAEAVGGGRTAAAAAALVLVELADERLEKVAAVGQVDLLAVRVAVLDAVLLHELARVAFYDHLVHQVVPETRHNR